MGSFIVISNSQSGDSEFFSVPCPEYPAKIYHTNRSLELTMKYDQSAYGFVTAERSEVTIDELLLKASGSLFFSANSRFQAPAFDGLVILCEHHRAMTVVGGDLEDKGRLQYVDGCTDTLVISPSRIGDPCLNALFFPSGIKQTMHTHPSYRIGMIVRGSGECETCEGRVALTAGMRFLIPADTPHAFSTGGEPLVLVAYHPDSDFGPKDNDHPMINRTIIDGLPANRVKLPISG